MAQNDDCRKHPPARKAAGTPDSRELVADDPDGRGGGRATPLISRAAQAEIISSLGAARGSSATGRMHAQLSIQVSLGIRAAMTSGFVRGG